MFVPFHERDHLTSDIFSYIIYIYIYTPSKIMDSPLLENVSWISLINEKYTEDKSETNLV